MDINLLWKSPQKKIFIKVLVEINSQIIVIVAKANKGLDKKDYSFNVFLYQFANLH